MYIRTVTTFVPIVDESQMQRQLRKIGEREDELATLARKGYELTHTATLTGPEFVTFVDTLTRDSSPAGH